MEDMRPTPFLVVAVAGILTLASWGLNSLFAAPHDCGLATCSPYSQGPCNACKNCRYCGHCNSGGECSVCK